MLASLLLKVDLLLLHDDLLALDQVVVVHLGDALPVGVLCPLEAVVGILGLLGWVDCRCARVDVPNISVRSISVEVLQGHLATIKRLR